MAGRGGRGDGRANGQTDGAEEELRQSPTCKMDAPPRCLDVVVLRSVTTMLAACDTQHEAVGKEGDGLFSFLEWLSVCPGPPVVQPEHTDNLQPYKPVTLL